MNLQINKINKIYLDFVGYVIYNEKQKQNQYKKLVLNFKCFEQRAKLKGLRNYKEKLYLNFVGFEDEKDQMLKGFKGFLRTI